MPDGSNRPNNRPNYGPHPDAVLLRKRRTERAKATVKLALAMVVKDDEPRAKPVPRIGPRGKYNKTRKCVVCGLDKAPILVNFKRGGKITDTCKDCYVPYVPKGRSRTKVCVKCGMEFRRHMFRHRANGQDRTLPHCRRCDRLFVKWEPTP